MVRYDMMPDRSYWIEWIVMSFVFAGVKVLRRTLERVTMIHPLKDISTLPLNRGTVLFQNLLLIGSAI
jgi:hypothetical protein